jgi:hypothetical protein
MESDEQPEQKLPHSTWGILSCLISLVEPFVGAVGIGVFNNGDRVMCTFIYWVMPVVMLLSVGLAVIGLRDKNYNHFFPELGLVINGLAFLVSLFIWVLFLDAGGPFMCIPPQFY